MAGNEGSPRENAENAKAERFSRGAAEKAEKICWGRTIQYICDVLGPDGALRAPSLFSLIRGIGVIRGESSPFRAFRVFRS
jgi:hypothetical protein